MTVQINPAQVLMGVQTHTRACKRIGVCSLSGRYWVLLWSSSLLGSRVGPWLWLVGLAGRLGVYWGAKYSVEGGWGLCWAVQISESQRLVTSPTAIGRSPPPKPSAPSAMTMSPHQVGVCRGLQGTRWLHLTGLSLHYRPDAAYIGELVLGGYLSTLYSTM